jgi:hypothetical protein
MHPTPATQAISITTKRRGGAVAGRSFEYAARNLLTNRLQNTEECHDEVDFPLKHRAEHGREYCPAQDHDTDRHSVDSSPYMARVEHADGLNGPEDCQRDVIDPCSENHKHDAPECTLDVHQSANKQRIWSTKEFPKDKDDDDTKTYTETDRDVGRRPWIHCAAPQQTCQEEDEARKPKTHPDEINAIKDVLAGQAFGIDGWRRAVENEEDDQCEQIPSFTHKSVTGLEQGF